jgi:hypothetical protein
MIKVLTKFSADRKANILKTGAMNEKEIVADAAGFMRERFKAVVSVYGEDEKERYDPKARAGMAMPGQPAIYIE